MHALYKIVTYVEEGFDAFRADKWFTRYYHVNLHIFQLPLVVPALLWLLPIGG